jgi:L-alanine-DL-glutamate epimerase-like enolase superfamily enzyme
MADAFGKQCIPHISSIGLGYIFMIHFVSFISNSGPNHEFKESDNVLPNHCATSSQQCGANGAVTLPSGPGFGVEIELEFLNKCEILSDSWL